MGPRRILTLELDPDAEPLTGSLGDEQGIEMAFVGWLGLSGAIEAILRRQEDVRHRPSEALREAASQPKGYIR